MRKRYSWIFKVALLLPVVLTFFCSSKDTRQTSTKTYEKDNVIYVENPASLNTIPTVYELKEILSIGDSGDDDNYVLARPSGPAVDDNGNIYVMDFRKGSVFAYDGKGVFLRKYGRQGEGPGETLFMIDFAVDNHNRMLYILDLRLRKVSRFLLDGTLHSEIKTEKYPDRLFLPGTNTYYIVCDVYDDNGKEFKKIVKYSLDGKKLAASPNVPSHKFIILRKGNVTSTLTPPFCAYSIFAVSPTGHIYWGMSDEYRFELFNPVLQEVKVILKAVSERVSVTTEEKEQYLKQVKKNIARKGYDPTVIDSSTIDLLPDYYPIYYSLGFDEENCLWVPLVSKEEEVQNIDIFDSEGVFAETRVFKKPGGILYLFDVFSKPVIKGDLIYAVVRDAEENWFIKVYRLVKQPKAK